MGIYCLDYVGLVGISGNAAFCTCSRLSKPGYGYLRKMRNNEWKTEKEAIMFATDHFQSGKCVIQLVGGDEGI